MDRVIRVGVSGTALVTIAMVMGSGCAERPVKTPAQKFRDDQKHTDTPHGKIVPESVQDRDGKITYQTTDGTKWTVDPPRSRGDGTAEYGTPQEQK